MIRTVLLAGLLLASPVLAHDMAPAEKVHPGTTWAKTQAAVWITSGPYRIWTEVGPVSVATIDRAWQTLRAAGGVALGVDASGVAPPAGIYFTTRARFDSWCRQRGCPAVPEGWVLLGVYWPSDRTLWTWQNPVVVPLPGALGGRQTLGHELTHHLLVSIDTDHVGGLHDRAGQWLNEVIQ